MNIDLKDHAEGVLTDARDRYIQDLEALSHDQLAARPNENTRSVYDFTYEIVVVNQRFLSRLNRQEPPDLAEGWIKAPEDFCNKDRAIADFRKSMDDVEALLKPLTPEEFGTEIPMKQGSWTIFRIVCFLAMHVNYHDGQLNYIQSLAGDGEVHWS